MDKTARQARTQLFVGWLFALAKSNYHGSCVRKQVSYPSRGSGNSHPEIDRRSEIGGSRQESEFGGVDQPFLGRVQLVCQQAKNV